MKTIAGANAVPQIGQPAAALLQQPHQLGLLGQESIVSVVAGHLAVLAMRAGGANGLGKAPYVGLRKEPVRADADESEPRADAAEGLGRRPVAAQRVPRIHGAQDGKISIRFEALDKAPALLIEIAGDIESSANEPASVPVRGPWVLAAAIGIAPIPLLEQRRRLVAEHGDLPGQRKPAARRLLRQITAALPLGIVLDGLALQVVQRKPHCAQRRNADD